MQLDTTEPIVTNAAASPTEARARILRVRARDLLSFAEDAAKTARPDDELPTTPRLACSQAANPQARPDDVLLLVAYVGNKCAAYLGLMPGQLRLAGRFERVRYMSGWYVCPDYRGLGLGRRLLQTALELPHDLLSTGNSPAAEHSFRRLDSRELAPLVFHLTYLQRSPLQRAWKRIAPRRRGPSVARELVVDRPDGGGRLAAREVSRLGREAEQLLISKGPVPALYRGVDVIDWMVHNPWIMDDRRRVEPRYHFSVYRDAFRYVVLEARDVAGGAYAGFMVLAASVNNRMLKLELLDYCFDRDVERAAARILSRYAHDHRADALVVTDRCMEHLSPLLPEGSVTHRRARSYFWWPCDRPSPLAEAAPRLRRQQPDGDTAFV